MPILSTYYWKTFKLDATLIPQQTLFKIFLTDVETEA